MIKVYLLKSRTTGFELQAACTPFGVLLISKNGCVKEALSFGYTFMHRLSLRDESIKNFKRRYRVLGTKMVEYKSR